MRNMRENDVFISNEIQDESFIRWSWSHPGRNGQFDQWMFNTCCDRTFIGQYAGERLHKSRETLSSGI